MAIPIPCHNLYELIVHYWIETRRRCIHWGCLHNELIVHYWIETRRRCLHWGCLHWGCLHWGCLHRTNCTLLNWNVVITSVPTTPESGTNCTLLNWNQVATVLLPFPPARTNCTLLNWNNSKAKKDRGCIRELIVHYWIETYLTRDSS